MATCVLNSCGIASRKRSFEPLEEEEFDLESQLSAILKKGRFGDYVFPTEDSTSGSGHGDDNRTCPNPTDKEEWVDSVIKEMTAASCVDDAKSRAGLLFDGLKETITSEASETTKSLSEQNSLLKKAVVIQHRLGRELEDKMNREVSELKQTAVKFEEQLKSLKMSNYALTVHLNQALSGGGMTPGFNPHVY